MKRHLSSAVCVAALLLVAGAAADVNFPPAIAQDVQVDFDTFHEQLAPYGDWDYSDRWGEVWVPTGVSDDFHPYGTNGHWANTDEYGWTWASDYAWGDIPFHYGRWVNDPDDGWMWIPGYVWSPGWVAWRHNGQYTGWMPLPPDDAFMGHTRPGVSVGINIGGVSVSFGSEDDDYGYSRWYGADYGHERYAQNWVFIGTGHMAERDYRRYEAPRNNYGTIIRTTTNITNYTVVNNYIVNRSVDPRAVQRAGGRFQTVRLGDVVKRPQFVTRADTGVQMQERARMDRPHGTGFANSAPKPTAIVVQSLSTKVPPPHGGHAHMHLFTRDTVARAPLPPSPASAGGAPPDHHGAMTPPPGMNGPANTEPKHEMRGHGNAINPSTNGPAMTGPGMQGPGRTTEPKHEAHGHGDGVGPAMSGPGMTGPARTPVNTEPKHGKHVHDTVTGSGMTGPAMSGPMTTTQPKRERHVPVTAPSRLGPAMTSPARIAPVAPKHVEHVRAPVAPAAPAPAEPKAQKEPHKNHGKPGDNGAPH